jgi:hypothetical protein
VGGVGGTRSREMQIREGGPRRGAASAARSPMSAMMLAMFATMASFYVAGRLWQDAQSRVYLIKELDRRTGQVGAFRSTLFYYINYN